jgi:hypothetical protein
MACWRSAINTRPRPEIVVDDRQVRKGQIEVSHISQACMKAPNDDVFGDQVTSLAHAPSDTSDGLFW